jgi:eukaryotic-like serine/threonine-protein kinase
MGHRTRVAPARIEMGSGEVTPDRWQEVKNLLAAALERPPQERSGYLEQACSEPALRREVESLLAAHDQPNGSFLERLATADGEPLKPGDTIGPYEILARIGAGGMGIVYRARDSRLEREVAIKILSVGLLSDDGARRRFRKEALALAKLSHANVAAVYDVGEQGGTDYIVMECVPGLPLAEKLKSGALLEKEISSLGSQIAAALEEAHEQGIIHRDLKPANVMVTPKGQAKVLDFGLAKLLPFGTATTQSFAESHALVGTLPYMAPEQLEGDPVDARTDIHALGLVLYEMASGRRLFQQDSIPQLTDAILHRQPVTPRAYNARVSPELERIILKCLEKEPDNRYQSAKELGVDLRHLGAPQAVTSVSAAALAPARSRRSLWPILAGAAALVAAATAGAYFYLHRAPKLTEKDSIVIADFANSTGDPVFDGTLRQGLTAQLQQTPFLQLVSGDRISQALRLMEKPANTRLTNDVARQICQRVNATALIEGSIAALGSQYVLGLDALNCSTGEILDQEQVTAGGKETVLAALGTAASAIRKKLGESAGSLQTYDVPFDQAITTSSLEALQAYTRGTETLEQGDFPSAISFFQRAVAIDPNFATAYSTLGIAYHISGEGIPAAQYLSKAYSLRERASEREQFTISLDYAEVVTGDLDEEARIGEQWAKVFPRDAPAYLGQTSVDYLAGQFEQGLAAAREYIRLDPTPIGYWLVALGCLHLGRPNEARATTQEAKENHVDSAVFADIFYGIAFLGNDSAAMERVSSGPWPFYPLGASDAARANSAAYHGQLRRSRELSERAIAAAKQQGSANVAAAYTINSALTEALLGNSAEARKALEPVSSSSFDPFVKGNMAVATALSGDVSESQKLARDLDKQYPQNTYIRFGALPTVQGLAALHRGKPDDAIEALSPVSSRELLYAWNRPYSLPFMLPVYVRGQSYLDAHRGAEAAAQFQMILDHPGFVLNSITGALARLGLGRAYALQAESARGAEAQVARVRAHAAYQDFLTLWKNADLDIPVLRQAKSEYSKLQ